MRELDPKSPPEVPACAVVGAGRLGTVLAAALGAPALRRNEPVPQVDVVLLCVPDGQIASAAQHVPGGPLLGHCSGATGPDLFARREARSLPRWVGGRGGGVASGGGGRGAAGARHAERALVGTPVTR